MRLRYATALAAALLLLAPSAHATTGYSATLSGLQEVPADVSPATGFGAFVLDNTGTQLSYSVSYNGLLGPLTAAHIHNGAVGVNGPVVYGLNFLPNVGTTSGTISGVLAVTPLDVSNLAAGLYYVNIHTQVFPGGEIRGQIGLDATPSRPTSWGRMKSLYR